MDSNLNSKHRGISLFDAFSELMITLELDLRTQWANQKAGELVNMEPENLVGQYCYQVLRGRQSPCEECPVLMTIQTEEKQEIEREAPDGRCYNVRSYPLYSQEGILNGVAVLGLDITDRKLAEEAHKESAEKYRNLAENTRDILFSLDAEGITQYVSPQVKQYGFEREDLEGQFFLDIVLPDDREQIYGDFLKTIEEGKVFFSECRIPTPDGNTYWFEEISDIELDATGTIRRITGVLRDITARKQAEEALRQSENYHRAIFETSGTAMFIIEEDTTISHVNSNFEELTGYTRQEIEGKKSWIELTHPDDVAWIKGNNYLRSQDLDDALRQYEFRYFTRHGEKRNLLLTVDKIPGTKRMIASGIDITERKQMEQALRESENRYRQERNYFESLFEHSADAIGIMDEKGRMIRWNKRALEISGYSLEEIRGRHFSEFYANREEMEGMLQTLRTQGSINDCEVSLVTKNGMAAPCSISVSIMRNESGKNLGSVNIIRDLTEWKKTLQRLEDLSIHDHLTGLYNRNFFEEEMSRLSDGRHTPLGIIVADLDGLKFVNDTLGHQAGDRMLIAVADLLRNCFRSSDIIARIGGDEFVVLLPQSPQKKVEQILQRLCQAVQDYNGNEPEIPLSLSLGYAVSAEAAVDMQALFREADNRMYREKLQRKGEHQQ